MPGTSITSISVHEDSHPSEVSHFWIAPRIADSNNSVPIDVDHGLRKRLWRFLRQIVANAARDDPVCILAGEFLAIGCGVGWVWSTIRIAFEGNSGHGDGREHRELLFEIVKLWFAFGQSEPKAIVVNHDGHVIRIIEGRRGAIECSIIEVPLGRGDLPDELGKITAYSS